MVHVNVLSDSLLMFCLQQLVSVISLLQTPNVHQCKQLLPREGEELQRVTVEFSFAMSGRHYNHTLTAPHPAYTQTYLRNTEFHTAKSLQMDLLLITSFCDSDQSHLCVRPQGKKVTELTTQNYINGPQQRITGLDDECSEFVHNPNSSQTGPVTKIKAGIASSRLDTEHQNSHQTKQNSVWLFLRYD